MSIVFKEVIMDGMFYLRDGRKAKLMQIDENQLLIVLYNENGFGSKTKAYDINDIIKKVEEM